jgi:hypothetical protein
MMRLSWPFSKRSNRLVGQQKVGMPLRFSVTTHQFPWKYVLAGFFVLALLVVGSVLFYQKFFAISAITIDQVVMVKPSIVPVANLKKAAQYPIGSSLVTFDVQKYKDKLLQQFPSLSAIRVQKVYPRTLTMTWEQRIPVCILITPSGSYLVDRQGLLFAQAPQDMQGIRLPSLTAQETKAHKLGEKVSIQGVVLGVYLAKNLHTTTPQLEQMVLHDGQLDVHFSSPPLVYINDSKSPEVAVKTLQVLFETFGKDNRYPNIVDLRYDRPVLRY